MESSTAQLVDEVSTDAGCPVAHHLGTTLFASDDFPAAHSMDTTWFAADGVGHVAAFDSQADGWVPGRWVTLPGETRKTIGQLNANFSCPNTISDIEFISEAIEDYLVSQNLLDDDWRQRWELVGNTALNSIPVEPSKQSIYTFSGGWFDSIEGATIGQSYVRSFLPNQPITVNQLPGACQSLLELVTFKDIIFSNVTTLNDRPSLVSAHWEGSWSFDRANGRIQPTGSDDAGYRKAYEWLSGLANERGLSIVAPDDYPAAHSGDVEWFAVDKDGHIAYFNPWNSAPIPKQCKHSAIRELARKDGTFETLVKNGSPHPEDSQIINWHLGKASDLSKYFIDVEGINSVFEEQLREFGRAEVRDGFKRHKLVGVRDFIGGFIHRVDVVVSSLAPVSRFLEDGRAYLTHETKCGYSIRFEKLSKANVISIMESGHCLAVTNAIEDDNGMFYYHDCDPEHGMLGPYYRTSFPVHPATIDQLPKGYRDAIAAVSFDFSFFDSPFLQPLDHTDCICSWESYIDVDQETVRLRSEVPSYDLEQLEQQWKHELDTIRRDRDRRLVDLRGGRSEQALNLAEIETLVVQGFIEVKQHPKADLRIYNYTQKAQEEWHWTPETIACRGLIVDSRNQIQARPFEKFFSYDQLEGNVPDEPFEAYEKLDGSLGVMYWTDEGPAIATRGSFTSNQAKHATRILRTRYSEIPWKREVTYLFEVIFPQNRIVVDYGAMEDIVLLAAIETNTGVELPLDDLEADLTKFGVNVVRRYDGFTEFAQLLHQNEENREGFVVRFDSGMRVKIKFEEYKRLHKFMLGVNPLRVWELLRSGAGTKELVEKVPDHFEGWVERCEADLQSRFSQLEAEAKSEMREFETRKEFADYAIKCKHKKILFLMLDGKDYSDVIWKMIRPSIHDAFLELADDPMPKKEQS